MNWRLTSSMASESDHRVMWHQYPRHSDSLLRHPQPDTAIQIIQAGYWQRRDILVLLPVHTCTV